MRCGKKSIIALLTIGLLIVGFLRPDSAVAEYEYQLYQNHEKFGILVFPVEHLFAGLDEFIRHSGFSPVESGHSVMRFGPNNENQTYMMPESIQKKYSMDRFIILQVLAQQNILVGIFDPDWGLTLPSAIYRLEGLKENIPKTLNIFRKQLNQRETRWHEPPGSNWMRLFAANAVTMYLDPLIISKQH